ncbi:sensor histidine kinase [Marinobacterium marinum]|uniref:histidine kinase n=1 Tax=Marinobacterium marinum TaxID=2756129 RepID=A0A7W1WX23_9GAMM|nr:sensor histidine kinase [Marinobacterium marinum]MBA4501819.1 sensor histidine kinase [Marinobacterium marinum]
MIGRVGSLESRIRRQLLLGLLAVMLVLLAVVHFSVTRLTQSFVASQLADDAENLIAALEWGADKRWSLNTSGLAQAYQRVHSGHYYMLQSGTTRFRSRSLWDTEPHVNTLAPGKQLIQLQAPVAGQHWLVVEQGFVKEGQSFTLWLAEDITELRNDQQRFEFSLLLLLGLSVPALLLLQRRVLQRGFARLEPLRQALAQQQAGEAVALPGDVPDEVAPLVASITQLLHQSGQQISRSRMALGNLAHELKRPLQQLQWMADQHPDPEQGQQLTQLYQELLQRVERELRRARIAGAPGPGRQFVPEAELPHLVQLLKRIGRADLNFVSQLPSGAVPFDRDDMLELLGNLLDNAWRHAGSRVHLALVPAGPDPREWWLIVEDDGVGVASENLHQLSARGVRIDENNGDGSGLGLSICRAIADSYAGTVEFGRSEMGGLKVQVTLKATWSET